MIELKQNERTITFYLFTIVLAVLVLFLFTKFVSAAKAYRYIGAGVTPATTISISGHGEVFAIPDIATIDFTADGKGANAKEAQDKVSVLTDAALAKIKALGIAESDIKTINYYANPEYQYQPPCNYYPCPAVTNKITGYTVSETIEVKVRNTDDTAKVLTALTDAGINQVSGPNFTIDDQTAVENEARDKAITDAKTQAETLANSLGVKIVRIVGFSESGNYPGPIMYDKAMSLQSAGSANVAPSLPTGESKITSDVTVTYEIQ